MASSAAEQDSTTAATRPFLCGKLIVFPGSQKERDFGDVFLRVSSDMRFTRASSNPQHADDFVDCDVIVELQRVVSSSGDSDDEFSSPDAFCSSEGLADSAVGVVGPLPGDDDCALSIYGNVRVCEQDQGAKPGRRRFCRAVPGSVRLIAGSRKARDIWLLLLRARVAPVKMWHAACRAHAPNCGPMSHNRFKSFFHERSSYASQGEIAKALLGERTRWERDKTNTPEQPELPYGEGSTDDVSDAALLLHTSVMLVAELSAKVGAAASMREFDEWHEGNVALCSMKDSAKVVCSAVLIVTSAVMGGIRDASMGPMLDALIGCWDCLLVVMASLLEISSTGTVSESTKESLQEMETTIHEHASKATVAQLAVAAQLNPVQSPAASSTETRPTQSTASDQDRYQASFRVDIASSLAAAKEGSPQCEHIIEELLSTDATDDLRPVAVTSVSGEGGAGKTTTCVLALRDARVKARYEDGVLGFEVGVDAQQKDIIQKIASIVDDCHGTATARSIRDLTQIQEAARQARRFFSGRRILLYLDNVWPDSAGLHDLMSMASERDSRVLFSTRSSALAADYTDKVVELGTLRLDVPEERSAAEAIFYRHLGPQRGHSWCSQENVDEALSIAQGLPIAIATLAALIRNKLVRRTTTDVLGQVSANLHNPPASSSRNVEHKGLFAAMAESLDFLDRQCSENGDVEGVSKGLMTRRYASLHAVDRSEDRVDKFVLAIVWNTSVADAESTAGELFSLGLARLASPDAGSGVDENGRCRHDTLTLHDLQVEYSRHVSHSGRHGMTVAEVHETAVRGMFGTDVDIDALTADDYLRRCGELFEISKGGGDFCGRYVVSNLVRHLLGSLTPQNTPRRWATILRLLSDARWLFMWQRVDGWLPVYNQYITIADKLPSEEILESLPRGDLEIVSEIGRAAREVPCHGRLFSEGRDTEIAASDLFRRVHVTWREESDDAASMFIERLLRSLYEVAGEWWLRPLTACHGLAVRHDALLLQFRVPQARGCALAGDDGHVAVISMTGVVRLFDKNGILVYSHHAHAMDATDVCVGRGSGDAEHRLFSVSEDGTLVLWDVILRHSPVGHVRASDPIVVDEVEEELWAVACATDGRVIIAGGDKGDVYLWVLNEDNGPHEYNRWKLTHDHTSSVRSVAVSPDGATVLSGSEDRTCRMWRIADAVRDGAGAGSFAVLKKESEEEDRSEQVWSCAFADEGRVVVTGHFGGTVKVWRVGRETPMHEVKLGEFAVTSLAAIGDAGREVVAGTATGTAHVVRVRDGAVIAEIGRADFDTVGRASASCGSGRVVACAHNSGRVELWDLERLPIESETDASTPGRKNQPQRPSRVYSVSSSPCGSVVASGHEDGWVRCWNGRSGRCLWEYEHESAIWCVCVSADAAHIACACSYGIVIVLDTRDGSIVRRWQHSGAVYSVSLHKLSDELVWSGHWNGEVVVWSESQDSPVHMQTEHGAIVDDLAVGADGMSGYARDRSGRISRLRIVGDGFEVEQVAPPSEEPDYSGPNGALFAELTAHGHRTAGHYRRHARVRKELRGETNNVSVRFAVHDCGVEVDLEIPNTAHVIRGTADFDSAVYSLDAAVSRGGDDGCDFVQIVCGLYDGRVCILREPLTRGSEAYDAVESWERYLEDGEEGLDRPVGDGESVSDRPVGDGESVSDRPVGDGESVSDRPVGDGESVSDRPGGDDESRERPNEQLNAPGCFRWFGSLMSLLCKR